MTVIVPGPLPVHGVVKTVAEPAVIPKKTPNDAIIRSFMGAFRREFWNTDFVFIHFSVFYFSFVRANTSVFVHKKRKRSRRPVSDDLPAWTGPIGYAVGANLDLIAVKGTPNRGAVGFSLTPLQVILRRKWKPLFSFEDSGPGWARTHGKLLLANLRVRPGAA